MSEQNYLYVVFSSTKCGIGSFIRFMTGNLYNHMSVTLNPQLSTLYSFARHHKNAPFYGGFVRESCLRYQDKSPAAIKVAAIKLTDEQYDKAQAFFNNMQKDKDKYLYNLLAAATNIVRRKVNIRDTYTCVEFAVKTMDLLQVDSNINANNFYTINQLEQILSDRIIYEGLFPNPPKDTQWEGDVFATRLGFLQSLQTF